MVTYKTLNEEKSRRPSIVQSPDKIQFGDLNVQLEQEQNQQNLYADSTKPQLNTPDYYKPKIPEATEVRK